ncbi:sensor histidine kinase [Actinoplanes sp. NPDC051513]|uniref:sensor histidine kinase n=1 Tax=Actinoplanes sp. NPDC051513 TaxID=3363908 RepID=UPI00379E72FF
MTGVRGRTTAAAAAIVGVALAVGGLLLVLALRHTLTDQVTTNARLRAERIAALLDAGARPADIALADEEDWLAQIIDGGGTVVAATPRLGQRPPLTRLRAGESAVAGRLPAGDGCPCLVVALSAAGGRYLVTVAQTMDPVTEGTAVLAVLLAAGIPLLVALVAVTTWATMGRTLAPVEAIRRRVGEITDRDLTRRVPQPAGTDEIARLAGTMNAMLARLQAAQERQRRFVSDASHELRSPVTAIRHELEVALADPAAVDIRRMATDLLVEARRQQQLVDDLLELARADESPTRRRHEKVDLDDLVLAEARRVRERGIRVDATGIGAGRVDGDLARLARMLRNLVDNAMRHAESTVRLSVCETGGGVRLVVANDGPPIPDADRVRVFERFTRLDDARARRDGGAGLGLAIVAEIVAAHLGAIEVGSEDGWTSFAVHLPAAAEQ